MERKKEVPHYGFILSLFKGLGIVFIFIESCPVNSREWATNKYLMNACEKE